MENKLTTEKWDDYLDAIETELRDVIDASDVTEAESTLGAEFKRIFTYHLGWTDADGRPCKTDRGKRLRPLLCLWCCEATGRDWHNALPAAASIELLHNFSLMHDDIEDNSGERRGRPAAWKVWGIAHGVNAGDAMFVLARLSLDKIRRTVSPTAYADIHEAFDAACLALTQGQFLDLIFESRNRVSMDEYIELARGKTAALLSVAAEIGARVGTENDRVVESLARFGENIGIAFQIVDDVIGIWGDPSVTGKPNSSDLASRKKSFPIVAAMEADKTGEFGTALRSGDNSQEDARRIINLLDRMDVRGMAEEKSEEYLKRALSALDESHLGSPPIDRLKNLAFSMISREK